MTETLVHINAPRFCAGVVLQRDRVVACAPILRHMYGWRLKQVQKYCAERHRYYFTVIKVAEARKW